MTMFPFALCSYLFGLTEVKFRHFMLGTTSSSMHVLMYLYLGTTLRHFKGFGDKEDLAAEGGSSQHGEIIILLCELIFAIGVGSYISFKAKKELDRLINESNNSNEETKPLNCEMQCDYEGNQSIDNTNYL